MLSGIFTQHIGGFHGPALFVERQGYTKPLTIENVSSKKQIDTEQVQQQGGADGTYGPSKPGFPGEKHVYMKTDAGIVRANFAGPGTKLKERLARGDKPINEVDRISKAHDLRYGLAKNYDDVRKADEIMLGALGRMKGDPLSRTAAQAVMKGKLLLEDVGVKRGTFAQHGTDHSPETTALFEKELAPLAQQGLGRKPGGKKQKFVKGSPEAKAFMAALRAKRKKCPRVSGAKKLQRGDDDLLGGTLRLAGDGMHGGTLRLAGDGFRKKGKKKSCAKPLSIEGGALSSAGGMMGSSKQAGGLGFLALALPTLAGIALKGLASYGAKKGATALINKMKGQGYKMHGKGILKSEMNKYKALFEQHVSGPLKQKAMAILEQIQADPMGKMEEGMRALLPILVKMAEAMGGVQAGSGDFKAGDSVVAYLLKHFGKMMATELKKKLGIIKPELQPHEISDEFRGLGFLSDIKKGITKATSAVDKTLSKLPVGEANMIRQIVAEIKKDPTILEDPQYLMSRGLALSPMGQRMLNEALRKAGVPVAVSLTM